MVLAHVFNILFALDIYYIVPAPTLCQYSIEASSEQERARRARMVGNPGNGIV